MFFLILTRNKFAVKFVKWVKYLDVFRECIFYNIDEFMFIKWVRFFERRCIVKWMIIIVSFYWLWDFILENLKLKDTLQVWDFVSFVFWSKFRFSGSVLWNFNHHIDRRSLPRITRKSLTILCSIHKRFYKQTRNS